MLAINSWCIIYAFEFKCGNTKIVQRIKCRTALKSLWQIIYHLKPKYWVDMCRVCHTFEHCRIIQMRGREREHRLCILFYAYLTIWSLYFSFQQCSISLSKYFVLDQIGFSKKKYFPSIKMSNASVSGPYHGFRSS